MEPPIHINAAETFGRIREDIRLNRGWPKSQLVLTLYRIAFYARQPLHRRPRAWAIPIGLTYRFIVEWVLGVEIPWRTIVGRRVRLFHGVGLVINESARLGDDVELRHGVTIGNDGVSEACPVIGDRVSVGAGAVVIGGVAIGDDARIGANAVVLTDVPPFHTAVGVPARVLANRIGGATPDRSRR